MTENALHRVIYRFRHEDEIRWSEWRPLETRTGIDRLYKDPEGARRAAAREAKKTATNWDREFRVQRAAVVWEDIDNV